MFNVACAAKKTPTQEAVTIYKNIDTRNIRSAIYRARVNMALSSGVTRDAVKVKCFCMTDRPPDALPPKCDPKIKAICEVLK